MELKQISLPKPTARHLHRVCRLVCTEFESMLNANSDLNIYKIQIVQKKAWPEISNRNNNAGIPCTQDTG